MATNNNDEVRARGASDDAHLQFLLCGVHLDLDRLSLCCFFSFDADRGGSIDGSLGVPCMGSKGRCGGRRHGSPEYGSARALHSKRGDGLHHEQCQHRQHWLRPAH